MSPAGYGLGGYGFDEPWGSVDHGTGTLKQDPKFMNAVFKALLPPGSIWRPVPDGEFDKFIYARGNNWQYLYNFMKALAYIREPLLTPILSDLEKEYGIVTDTAIDEDVRRQELHSVVYAKPGTGSLDDLQDALTAAGFTAQVHANDPIVDPALIITDDDLLVNGELVETQQPAILMQCDGPFVTGNANAVLGFFRDMNRTPVGYHIPTDPRRWNFIFFVGGNRTGPTTIVPANIPTERRSAFLKIILKYKPLHSWAGLVVNYV